MHWNTGSPRSRGRQRRVIASYLLTRGRTGKLSSPPLADQLKPLILGENRYSGFLGLVELRAGARPRDHIIRLLRYRASGLGAETLRHRLGLIARHLLERAGEHHGLAGHH